jgi:large subunit ribosomal protein L15
MRLNDVHKGVHKNKKRRRVGRGKGSGWGKTSGRGHKGQGQLAGWTAHPTFEGGRMPVVRRVPKRGFHNRFARLVREINVSQLEQHFKAGDKVTLESLREAGVLKGDFDELKVLGNGELTKKLSVSAHRFSKSAVEKIQRAGGETVVLAGPKAVPKNKMRTGKKD